MKPFLKWPGNKYRLMQHIISSLPPGGRLVEPFIGSGAVFLNTAYPRYVLADGNPDLVTVYQYVKKEGLKFIERCADYFVKHNNNQKRYYQLREQFNETQEPALRAALFVYLNRHSYNGLCRYNRSGLFNVPFGDYVKPYFPQEEMLYCYQRLKKATIKHADFRLTMKLARKGDVCYCDPPYAPLSKTARFTQYLPKVFDEQEQLALVDMAWQLVNRGVPVLISNHDTSFIRTAYQGAAIIPLQVRRYISCQGWRRNHAPEILALFTP